jgi:1-phosphatidylinositol phosphodiesterase
MRRLHFLEFLSLAFLTFLLCTMLFSVLLALSPCFWLVSSKCYHGYQSDFSFDAGIKSQASWMASIPDAVNFTSLSVPGTHDSFTFDVRDPVFQCQNRNFTTQLRAGLRYFDVRARLRDDELQIYHGGVYTGYSYVDVLLGLFGFLEEYPSEAIVIRVKEEGAALGASTRTFEEAFNYYRFNDTQTADGCAKHFYSPEAYTPLPALRDLRSKILILQNFPAKSGPYGIGWESPLMVLEDLWEIQDTDHLYLKWNAIRTALELAASSPDDNSALFLSHLSATEGVLPIQAAVGPLNRTVQGMNDLTGRWLEDGAAGGASRGRTGVVMMDFPGQRLIDAVLARNQGLVV